MMTSSNFDDCKTGRSAGLNLRVERFDRSIDRELYDVADGIVRASRLCIPEQRPVSRDPPERVEFRPNVEEIHGIAVVKLAEVEHEFDAVAGRENEEFVAFLIAVAVADGNGMREKPAIRPDEMHGNVRIADLEHVEAGIGAVEKAELVIARCDVQLATPCR